MLLQPQPLAQHLLQRFAGRAVLAGDRFQLRARGAQAGFQPVRGVEQARHRAPACAAATADHHGGGQRKRGHQQEQQRKFHPGSLAQAPQRPQIGPCFNDLRTQSGMAGV